MGGALIIKLLKIGKLTIEEIAECSELSVTEVEQPAAMLKKTGSGQILKRIQMWQSRRTQANENFTHIPHSYATLSSKEVREWRHY